MKGRVYIAVFALLACAFFGCARQETAVELEPEPVPLSELPEDTGWSGKILIGRNSGEDIEAAAQFFADKVRELGEGAYTLDIARVPDEAIQLGMGGAVFAFIDSAANPEWCSSFPVLSTPFLYNSYLHFTTSTNSEQVLAFLSEEMRTEQNALPVASYYTGSPQLLTYWRTSNAGNFEGATLSVSPDSRILPLLKELGVAAIPSDTPEERLQQVLCLESEGLEYGMEPDAVEQFDNPMFLSLSYHDISPLWLVVDCDWYGARSEREQAILSEASAYLFDMVDQNAMRKEQTVQELLMDQGVEPITDLSAIRARIHALLREDTHGMQRYLLDMILDMAEYAH